MKKITYEIFIALTLFITQSLMGNYIYETYLESWDSQWNQALTGLPPTPSSSPTTYDNVVLNIAFASYTFPGLNGLQFSDSTADTNTVINYVHSQAGLVKIAYGGASYAGPNYFISQTYGWPNNIPSLVAGVKEVVTSYGFDGVDFDIEDALPTGMTAQEFADQLFTFLTQIRLALPGKMISLTIPGQGWGTYWKILAQQVAAAKTVDTINFMEYDIWIGAPSYPAQIKADIQTYTSPTNTSPAPNNAPGWGIPSEMIQLGLMPGNDDQQQFLTVDDSKDLAQYAASNNLFGVMTWDIDRDAGTNPVPSLGGAPPYAYSNAIRGILYAPSIVKETLNPKKKMIKGRFGKTKKNGKKQPSSFERQRSPHHGAPG